MSDGRPVAENRVTGCPDGTHPECYINAQQPGDCQCFDEWEDAVAAGLSTRGLFNPDTPELRWPDDWESEEEPGDTDMEARGQITMGLPEGITLEMMSKKIDHGPYPITGGDADNKDAGTAMQDHIGQLLRILGLGDHARPESPAAVMEHEIIPAVKALASTAEGSPSPPPTYYDLEKYAGGHTVGYRPSEEDAVQEVLDALCTMQVELENRRGERCTVPYEEWRRRMAPLVKQIRQGL